MDDWALGWFVSIRRQEDRIVVEYHDGDDESLRSTSVQPASRMRER